MKIQEFLDLDDKKEESRKIKDKPRVFRDLEGVKINMLSFREKIRKHGRWHVVCDCECGGETIIREDFFVSGKTKSCGCFGSRNSVYKINIKAPGESAFNSHFGSYKSTALRRGILFHLSKEQFKLLTEKDCYYCGAQPRYSRFNAKAYGEYFSNGVDRLDSSKNYCFYNCVPCCSTCNIAKASMLEGVFIEWINRVKDYQSQKEFLLNLTYGEELWWYS